MRGFEKQSLIHYHRFSLIDERWYLSKDANSACVIFGFLDISSRMAFCTFVSFNVGFNVGFIVGL